MTANTSHAVRAQRLEPADSLDDFPTPPWAVRAFLEALFGKKTYPAKRVWEPAANRGYMVKALRERFGFVFASDILDYGAGYLVHDFVNDEPLFEPDWVITNPPFKVALDFVEQGLRISNEGVAVLVRTTWAEGITRYENLFRDRPPAVILQYVNRVPMVKGRYDPLASTATGYAWFVWLKDHDSMPFFTWINGHKADLYQEGDDLWEGYETHLSAWLNTLRG